MNKIIKKEIEFAGKKLAFETGELAFMTNMSVKATYGDTVILVTVVAGSPLPDTDFLPLTVNYEEKLYASGLIKTSRFVKRDGKPTDEAVIAKRLIDHAIRPLFPKDFIDEVQVIATVLSLDETADPEFLAMVATSAALHASDVPWSGPMTSVRVGRIDGEFVINPSRTEDVLAKQDLGMMVSFAGEDRKFLAAEAEAHMLPEETILGAINFARDNATSLVNLINDFAREVNPEGKKYEYTSKVLGEDLMKAVSDIVGSRIKDLLREELDKVAMHSKQEELENELLTALEGKYKKVDMLMAFSELEKKAIQHMILDEDRRPDGRSSKQVRDISTSVGILPRTHGSALFTRGVTQALTVATLGSPSLELLIQNMYGEKSKRFIHYYNFPPFASGETGRVGAPKSREIGHGMLAEKALRPVIPQQDKFPYMIMLVSETLSSSGSSSMAATCASSMALMDAGVPITDIVGGVGVGIIVNDDFSKYKILTDLAYMEDAYGFLDFKMTGTRTGVTALQVDMKVRGIPVDLLPEIIAQSKEGRLHVLDQIEKTINKPRESVSEYAPKMQIVDINPEKIGLVIGSGGKTIKDIQEKTSSEVFIDESGRVVVTADSAENAQRAVDIIARMTKEAKEGEIYEGEVVEILDFGALVEIWQGKVGLMHVSEIEDRYVQNVRDVVKIGDKVTVKVLKVGDDGKISLSKKAVTETEPRPVDQNRRGRPGGNTRDRRRR